MLHTAIHSRRYLGIMIFSLICTFLSSHVMAENSVPTIQMTVDASSSLSVSGADDIERLKSLTSGIGWEFSPNAYTTQKLKELNFKWLRCINVDPLPGDFTERGEFKIKEPNRLLPHLKTCRDIGALPHIIIGQGLHPALRLSEEDLSEAERGWMGNQARKVIFGPTDWNKFRAYCKAYFQYVLIDQNFPNAVFEVGNEPDIGGVVCPRPPKPANGSAALYAAYFNWYKNIAQAAQEFEAENPGKSILLGGPALAWAYTFKFGSFNWADRFVQDCAEQHVKINFIGVHFYGNISSIDGSYPNSNYPSFDGMYNQLAKVRDKWLPGIPIYLTEWGPSYHTNNKPESLVNADEIGTAWSAAYVNRMLQLGIERALYLVTTDLARQTPEKQMENIWGWPSLFTHPGVYGKAYPKAPYYLFDFIQQLNGTRVKSDQTDKDIQCISAWSEKDRTITMLLWNFSARLPEMSEAVDTSRLVNLKITLKGTGLAAQKHVQFESKQVNNQSGNPVAAFKRSEKPSELHSSLNNLINTTIDVKNGELQYLLPIAPSSITFIRISNIAPLLKNE